MNAIAEELVYEGLLDDMDEALAFIKSFLEFKFPNKFERDTIKLMMQVHDLKCIALRPLAVR